jgi:hypothetical protein
MSDERVGTIAEVATAAAAVAFPIVKVVSAWLERRRQVNARRYAAAAAVVEARMHERCLDLEARLLQIERQLRRAA